MDIRNLKNLFGGKKSEEPNEYPAEEENEEFLGDIDFSDGINVNNSPLKDITDDSQEIDSSSLSFDDVEEKNEGEDEDYEEEQRDITPAFDNDVPTAMNSISRYQSIDSAQQGFDIIAGINDVPQHYRDDNLLPELVMASIQYNNFQTKADVAEWQIKARDLLRKHEMYKPDYSLSPRDIAGYVYINDLQLSRATRGFERKMSNNNLSGVIEENSSEASPDAQPKRKSAFASMFGG